MSTVSYFVTKTHINMLQLDLAPQILYSVVAKHLNLLIYANEIIENDIFHAMD